MAFDHGENFFSDGRDPRRLASRTQLENQVEDRAEHEMARRRAEFAALQRRHRQEMDDLAAQKSSMFGRTPPEVAVNALTLAIEEAHHQAKLRAAEGKPEELVQDIRLFQAKIQGKEVAFHVEGKSGKPSFIDDGKNIFVPAYDDDIALLASLQLAQMRWGVVKVSGTEDFKERVVHLAADYDLQLANEDLALRVHQRRNSPGTLSAPTEQELAAAKKLHAELEGQEPEPAEPKAAGDAPAPKASVTTATTPEDEDDALIEDDTPEQEQAPEPAPATAEAVPTAPPADDKAWIAELQEERRRKAAERAAEAAKAVKAGKEGTMPKGEYDRAVEAEIQQLKAKGQSPNAAQAAKAGKDEDVPEEPIEIDEPEEEADLGFGDDDDFSLDLPSAATVTPEAKKTAGVTARP